MILLFPNLETLRLALTSSIVSTDVTLTPAAVTFDQQGKIYLEPTVNLSRTTIKNLDKIGVKGSKRHATDKPEEVTCWLQIISLTKEPGTPNVSNQAPVIFELSDSDDLPILVAEMLRLGNDRQSFRWFAASNDEEPKRVLLRVIGPPYYTLLRALDRSTAGTKGIVSAYVERASRVWIELGYTHPFTAQIRVAEKQLLLLRSPRDWVYLEETPFQDVYDILQFKLPTAPVGWMESKAIEKMSVPLRLTAGNAADVPELWVLRQNAIKQLDTLVRDSDEKLTQRLKFAVATDPQGTRTVILRTIPSKLPPPSLPLENALGFKPFWKLPNLFVPIGRRLHPTLRRDAVRRLLADDADQVVWLYPDEAGAFTPESVHDGAFRTLEDWVSYLIENEQKPLAAWIGATQFDFDKFICPDGNTKNKPDKGDKDKLKDDSGDGGGQKGQAPVPRGTSKAKQSPTTRFSAATDANSAPALALPQSEWVKRRDELVEQFRIARGLDAPERRKLWPELAIANARAGAPKTEVAICWLNAMWGVDPIPAEVLAQWLRSELPNMGNTIKADEFDRRLAQYAVSQEEARLVVASFLWLASLKPIPSWLTARLPAVQTYLENNGNYLPIRAVWLTAYRLSQLAGADVLGLARVRDRLLQRLLDEGLSDERDLPLFLQVEDSENSKRLQMVKEKVMELHAAVRKWSDHKPMNLPYIDLLFSYGLAKLRESAKCKSLLRDAQKEMEQPIPGVRSEQNFNAAKTAITTNFLYKAFKYRIDLALEKKPQTSQLAPGLLTELEEIGSKAWKNEPDNLYGKSNPYNEATYLIARMRFESRLLEPYEKLYPYFEVTKNNDDPLLKEIGNMHSTRDPVKLVDLVNRLLKKGLPDKNPKEVQFVVLLEGLPLSTRVGESFTIGLLQLVPNALTFSVPQGTKENYQLPNKQGRLLERSVFLAAHFGRVDLVKTLLDCFLESIHNKPDEVKFELINAVAAQCLRSLKKLGMRDEFDFLFNKLRNEILANRSLADMRKKYASNTKLWAAVVQSLLNLTSGWLAINMHQQASEWMEEARKLLLNAQDTKLSAPDYVKLARAYISACGLCPPENGLKWILDLFRKMDTKCINNFTTYSTWFSSYHLNIVEETIQAIVSDNFVLGPSGQKWLDDDEYLVRQRIHADMKRERHKSGL